MSTRTFFAGICIIVAAVRVCSGELVFTAVNEHAIENASCEIGLVGFTTGWAQIALKKHFGIEGGWSSMDDGRVRGDFRLECVEPCDLATLCLAARFDMAPVIGREWSADGIVRVLPERLGENYRIGHGEAAEYTVPLPGGKTLRFVFGGPVAYHAQDSRLWGPRWGLRFGGFLSGRTCKPGEKFDFSVVLSADGGIRVEQPVPMEIREGDDWVRLDYRKHPVAGSALDWSGMGLHDAPAGKYGWLKNVDGHFEFEGLPGVEQRFYGVNLCYDANYPEHEAADMLVERLLRCGYNSVRIHHHDGRWASGGDAIDRLDYLIARCIGRGLYITTDLYVSRRPQYRDIGIDKDGNIGQSEYKRAVATNDLAFSDWCAFAESFLRHVNPYTGRAYIDEPGLPLVSLVNEGGESEAVWERCGAFVRSLGARALLTNDNNGSRHGGGEGLTPRYDYVDNHFYIDHPEFLEKSWQLPSHCPNANPVIEGGPAIFRRGWAKGASKPYTITEWNFSGPGRYRAVGGIITGAMAAGQDWDGLWRFAFSHSDKGWGDSPNCTPGYFDLASDPLMAASDRASVCLYLRGDAKEVGGDLRAPRSATEHPKVAPHNTLCLDQARGSMAIDTPRTCGGFAENGCVEAGVLSFEIGGNSAPSALWVSSLDNAPLASSSRILLVHLTDVQGDGARYADQLRRTLLSWGRGCLMEAGVAKVTLCIDKPEECIVHELDTAGNRVGTLPTLTQCGALSFDVSTRGPNGGRIYYEIDRNPQEK